MAKIISELKIGEYSLLKIDETTDSPCNKVVVDGCECDIVPSYNLGDYNIVVKSPKFLNNKDIELVMQW